MRTIGARQIENHKPTPYATGSDFCRIFKEDMDHLYLLAFLLTGDRSVAEKCFVRGLDDSATGNPVFKEWAQSWARRTIIQNAIRMIQPRPTNSNVPDRSPDRPMTEPAEIANVVELPAFERFVFVMSMLERYSGQECALLLNCTRGEVIAARIRALEQIGRSATLHRKLTVVSSKKQEFQDGLGAHQLNDILHLATPA